MLIIYTGTTCPYCRLVEAFMDDKGIEYEARNVHENPDYLDELIESGGKRQIPYLIDTETGESMYESQDIMDYIEKKHGSEPQDIIT